MSLDRDHVAFDPAVGPDQLMTLIDNTCAAIYLRDLDGRYLLVNREYERRSGRSREAILGLTDHDLYSADIADAFRANDLEAAASGGPVQTQGTAPWTAPGDDGPHIYATTSFPLFDNAGTPYAIGGISTDITDRERADERVEELNAELERRVLERTAELEVSARELDSFGYSVSHDLRAPLRSLNGFSQVLLEDYADQLDDQGREYLCRLQANAARMTQMIDDLLDLSRTTRTVIRRSGIDITAVAESIVAELREAEPDREIQFIVGAGLAAEGDADLVRLALQNLIANAWKFTGHRLDAVVEVGALDDGILFVRDNGAGFDMRFAGKLFEPFQRLHGTTQFDGSGIGLAIVHQIVTRHGGRIWAESVVGEGATFRFRLAPAAVPTTGTAIAGKA